MTKYSILSISSYPGEGEADEKMLLRLASNQIFPIKTIDAEESKEYIFEGEVEGLDVLPEEALSYYKLS